MIKEGINEQNDDNNIDEPLDILLDLDNENDDGYDNDNIGLEH